MSLFTALDAINKKTKYTYNKKDVNGYMLAMWLSHDKELCKIVDEMNHLVFELPDKLVFKYFQGRVPKKNRFLKWTKKEGKKLTKKQEDMLQGLMDEHQLSKKAAMELMKTLQESK